MVLDLYQNRLTREKLGNKLNSVVMQNWKNYLLGTKSLKDLMFLLNDL